jgi:DNA-binding SARP family transcriptional activator/tetratricopeptide (TPR) repeat protein
MAEPHSLLRIFLFGAFQMTYQGRELPLPHRESLLRLFIRFLLQPNQPLSRKGIAFELWPETSEAEALANLRRHLYLLRGVLPPEIQGCLLVSTQIVQWVPGQSVWVDAWEYQKPARSQAEMEEVVTLYQDELLRGVYGDEYVDTRRDEFQLRYMGFLKKLASACIEQGRLERGLGWARKLHALDRWDEEAARLCMTLEVLSGRRSAALQVYQELASALESDLHTLPLPETMALYTQILHHRALPSSFSRTALSGKVFVGREKELALLGDGFYQAITARKGGIIFLSGPSGAGKTCLLQEAIRRVLSGLKNQHQMFVFWGICQPPKEKDPGARPYAPWKQILNGMAPLLARSQDFPAHWLSHLLPLSPDLRILRPHHIPIVSPDRNSLRAALRQSLFHLSMQSALVLIIEDVQWCDPESLEILSDLMESCPALPLLLILTSRTGEEPQKFSDFKRQLRRQRCLEDISLRRFDRQEVRMSIEASLNYVPIADDLLEEIYAYSGGLPLLIHEAVESLHQAQHETEFLSLRSSLQHRLSRLTDNEREMLRAAAILGYSFQKSILYEMLSISEQSFHTAFDTLLTQHILVENLYPEAEDCNFGHQMIYEILVTDIPKTVLERLHAQAARALETMQGAPEDIAYHTELAGDPVGAARYWVCHAREVTEMAAFSRALEILDRIDQQLLPTTALDPRSSSEAALLRVEIFFFQGRTQEAVTLADQVDELCKPFTPIYIRLLTIHGYALYAIDRTEEAHQLASQALQIARQTNDDTGAIQALTLRGMCDLLTGQPQTAVTELRAAYEQVQESSNTQPSARTMENLLCHYGTALVFVQEYNQAEIVLRRAVEMADQTGSRRFEASSLMMLGQIALNRGLNHYADRIYCQSLEVAGDTYTPGLWGKYAGRGLARIRCGNLAAAQADFVAGFQVAEQVGSSYGRLLMQIYQVMVRLAQGNWEGSGPTLAALEQSAAQAQLYSPAFLAAIVRGHAWRLAGDFPRALTAHQCAFDFSLAAQVPLFKLQAQTELLADRLAVTFDDKYITQMQACIANARQLGEVPILLRGLLNQAAARMNSHHLEQAEPLVTEALDLAQTGPDIPNLAEAWLLEAKIHLGRGDPQRAREAIARSRQAAQSAHGLLLPLAQNLLAHLNGQAPVPFPNLFDILGD